MLENKKNLNVLIITSEPFPFGGAATNRIISYSKGLVELGNTVSVLIFKPSSNRNNLHKTGIYYSINYIYSSNTSIWIMENIVSKIWIYFTALLRSVLIIKKKQRSCRIDFIIIVTNKLIPILLYYLISKYFKIKIIQEKSEFPFVLNKKSVPGKIYGYFYLHFIYRLFDGMIIMTKPLIEFFKPLVNRKAKLFLMPMTVEPERFSIKIKEPDENYIAYCGFMGGDKDGISNLIISFSSVLKENPDIKLYLIGKAGSKEEDSQIKSLAIHQCGPGKIHFLGEKSREEIPEYLINAKVLVLARPKNLQSYGGFPTKLGEYLATGNPVVVTKVGDIPFYLTDNENAFLVEPDNNVEFAKKINYVLKNPAIAQKVGEEGKKQAYTTFNYKFQSEQLRFFLNNLLNATS